MTAADTKRPRGRLLWVDDEIDLLKAHILYLEEKGYAVERITNGPDAVAAVGRSRFDLVLLDQVMPGQDGIATLRELKLREPSLPVVLITKNEEEWLMNEAIAAQTVGHLTKPVNPSQVFLVCKRVLEEDKIIGEKTASAYLDDFQSIERSLQRHLEMDEWWRLYQRLVQWQLELDERKELGLGTILSEQMKSANTRFSDDFLQRYLGWIRPESRVRPIMSPDVFERFVLPHARDGNPFSYLIIDCFRLDQAMLLLPWLRKHFSVAVDYHVALLPSATPFCRNALFSGCFPGDLPRRFPKEWEALEDDGGSLNRFEPQFLKELLAREGLAELPMAYHKVSVSTEGKQLVSRLPDLADVRLHAIVVNFVDLLTHGRAESEILQDMTPDDPSYRAMVQTWFNHSWLQEALLFFAEKGRRVVLTSDHGSVRVQKGVQVAGDRETSSGVRYKYGRDLNCSSKHAMVIKRPADYRLPEFGPGTNYLIARDDAYFLYPTQYHRYKALYQNSLQHGGVSLEELLVPTLTLIPR